MGYLETLKNITKDKKKKTENLILLLVLLVILLISMNYIFKDDKSQKESTISQKLEENKSSTNNDIESKIANILNQISGVTDISVIINYSDAGKKEYAYDTKEVISDEGNTTSIEKTIAYNNENGNKVAITSIEHLPQVEGVIIVGNGLSSSENKQKIATAVGNLLGVASYKVQVFNK